MARNLRLRNAVLLILGLLFGTFAFAAPAISTISPTAGQVSPVGSPVTINGSGLGATQGSSTVTIGGFTATPTSWTDSRIVASVPGALLPGFMDVIVTVGGAASNAASFLVIPAITGATPQSAPTGASVTIAGTSFGDSQGSSTVTFQDIPVTPLAWSNTSITLQVPDAAYSGPIVVTVNGFDTNGLAYQVTPTITGVSPAAAAVGTVVTVSGTAFQPNQNFSPVTFNGVSATPTSWSNTSFTVPVPSGATTGPLVATINSVASNGMPFIVTHPTGFYLTPDASTTLGLRQLRTWRTPFVITSYTSADLVNQAPGDYLVQAFDTADGVPNSSDTWQSILPAFVSVFMKQTAGTTGTLFPKIKLFLNGPSGTPICTATGSTALTTSQTLYNLSCTPSSDLTVSPSDRYYLWVGVSSTATPSSSIIFQLTTGPAGGRGQGETGISVPLAAHIPTIINSDSQYYSAGAPFTITGTDFGATAGTVTFNGEAAVVSSWSDTSITALVPNDAYGRSSTITIFNANSVQSNPWSISVQAAINNVTPSSGAIGSMVVISGSGFGPSVGTVFFGGGTTGIVTNWSDTSITATVPPATTTGSVYVLPADISAFLSNPFTFTVVPPPSIGSLSPAAGPIGSTVVIAGSNFGATQGIVTFNGVSAAPSLWSDTSITVPVPVGATTGAVLVTVNEVASNSASFTVLPPPPTITALNPTQGVAGTEVTITGTNFGTTQGDSQVQIGSQLLNVKTWSDTTIVATIAAGSTTGDILVTNVGQQSNGIPFTVIVTPLLSGSLIQTVTAVTLTTPLALDWEHWGATDDQPLVRMAGSQFLLSDLSVIGSNSPTLFSDGEIEYLWTDGDVLTTAERTTTGISISGTGNGFHLSVAADAIPKTLMLYVGAGSAQAQLTASVSDNSSAPYVDSSLNAVQGNDLSGTYRIDFRALQPGQTLNIDYVVLADHGNGADLTGQVSLESAEILPHLPDVAITSPADGQILTYPSAVSATVDASQIDFALAKVDFFQDGQNLFELTASPYSFNLVDMTPGDHVLSATATDVSGLAGTSDPVMISQIQGGGSLSATVDIPVDVDLSAGTTDWVHWGNPDSPNNIDRKAGVSPQISDLSTLANGEAYTSDETGHGSINYSWSGGAPTDSQAATGTQIFMQGYKNGFTITIPADTTVRTAKLYVGYGFGTSKLRASLSDGSAVPWVNTFTTTDFYNEKVITLQFQAASPGQTLLITDQVVKDGGFAYVDLEAATVSDQNSPVINTVSPVTGGSGTIVTISGSNFGDSLTGRVTLNGNVIAVNSWSDTSITATLSAGYSSGPIVVSQGMANSNSVPFTYLGPSITALLPSAGSPGTIVSIQGQFLSNGPGTASVTFGGIAIPVVSESATSIQVAVPAGISFGPAPVIVQVGGVSTNAFQFDVVQSPLLTSLTPNVGVTEKIIKITGSNLGRSQADSGVFFGDFEGTPISWSETEIEVPVPAGFYGGVVMALVAGHWSNGLPFEVPARCMVDCNAQRSGISLSPQNLSVVVGDQVDLGVTDNLGESVPYSVFTVSDPTIGSVAITNGNGSFTALAPGTTTVTATSGSFTSSTTVTVYSGPALPDGTIKWQVPVSLVGTSAQNFIPAQPATGSTTATFFEDSSNPQNVIIRALDANGRMLWAWPTETNLFTLFNTHVAPTPAGSFVYSTPFSINSIDANGHPLWTFPYPQYRFQPLTVGYDGTVYALVDFDFVGFQSNFGASHLVAIDAQRGTEKFRVPLPKGQFSVSGTDHDSSGTTPPENISRPMVLADGSINVAVSNRISVSIFSPNTHQAIPQNNSHDPNISGPAIYCPSEILECWAPVDSSGTFMQKEIDSTEGKQISLVNIQPDGSYKQYLISNSALECDEFGSHFKYVLDDGFLLPFAHVSGTVRNSNGVPVSDGHQYAQEIFSWFTGTCNVAPFGPNGFDLMVVPNGTGGLLVASETADDQNPVWIKNVPQPSVSGDGTEIHIAAINTLNNLVIGENGNAFAAGSFNFFDTPRLVSFNLATGTPNWTYDSPFHTADDPGYVDIVAAGPNNSLYAVEGLFFNVEPKVAFTLDANGVRTDNPTSNQDVTFVSSAGIGSSTWLGANVTQIASLDVSGLPFGLPIILQSSPPIGLQGVTAIASTTVSGIHSPYPNQSSSGIEKVAIPLRVHEIDGSSIDSTIIRQQINSALDYWQSHAGLLFSWPDSQIQIDPNCSGVAPSLCNVSSPSWLLDIVSSNPFDATVNAEEKGKKLQAAYSRFHATTGLDIIYVRQIDGAYALDIAFTKPVHQPTNVILSQKDRPISLSLGSTDLVMSHEIGHAFGLAHNRRPTNLMCANDPEPTGNEWVDFFVGLGDSFAENIVCGPAIEHRTLTDGQIHEVNKNAIKYFNFVPSIR